MLKLEAQVILFVDDREFVINTDLIEVNSKSYKQSQSVIKKDVDKAAIEFIKSNADVDYSEITSAKCSVLFMVDGLPATSSEITHEFKPAKTKSGFARELSTGACTAHMLCKVPVR